jgi:hypothetical protein
VSTMTAASASRPRPLATTDRQSFNLLTPIIHAGH